MRMKDWTPPIISRLVKYFFDRGIQFKGDYRTWEEASAECLGYDSELIFRKVLESTLKVKRGEAAYERDSVVFDEIEHAWPVTAGLMWAAAQDRGELDVLDFGGSLGSSYFENQSFLSSLPKVHWGVVEQSHYVVAGNDQISDERLHFYDSVEDCLAVRSPNVILLSAVLQYLAEPTKIIEKICSIGATTIIVDRTITSQSPIDKIYIQTVPPSIYAATYPCRSLSEENFMRAFSSDYKLECKFPSLNFPALSTINSDFNGYIFRKVKA